MSLKYGLIVPAINIYSEYTPGTVAFKMNSLVVLVGLLAVACAEWPAEITTAYHYHENIGIHEAIRIRQAEAALDFDGSRIVGGAPSNLGDNPHLVSVKYKLYLVIFYNNFILN